MDMAMEDEAGRICDDFFSFSFLFLHSRFDISAQVFKIHSCSLRYTKVKRYQTKNLYETSTITFSTPQREE